MANPSDIIAAAAQEYKLQPGIVAAAAMQGTKDGKPPALEDDVQKLIISQHKDKITGDPASADNQWQIYAYYIAGQVADYRDTLKAFVAIDSENPAPAAALLDRAINHGNPSSSLTHPSTATEYRPSGLLVSMVEKFEGFRDKVYTLNGVKHIGFGVSQYDKDAFAKLTANGGTTREAAEAQLKIDLQKYGAEIVHKFPGFLKLPQGVQDACVSYSYNCGVGGLMKSNAMKLFEAGDLVAGAKAIANGIHTAGGVNSAALEGRRKTESMLAQMDLQSGSAVPVLPNTAKPTSTLGTPQKLNQDPIAAVPVAALTPPTPVPNYVPHPAVIAAVTPAPAPGLGG